MVLDRPKIGKFQVFSVLGLVLGGNHTLRRGHPGPLGTALLPLLPPPHPQETKGYPAKEPGIGRDWHPGIGRDWRN